MNDLNTETDRETTLDSCVRHGREVLAAQSLLVKEKDYDFAPEFQEMTTHLYLVGVMWRHGEQLELAENARSHAFTSLHSLLVSKGMSRRQASKRIAFLNRMSRTEDGNDALALSIGYEAGPNDDSLIQVLDQFLDEVRVSGSLWRLYDRTRKTMLIGGGAVAFLTFYFFNILGGTDWFLSLTLALGATTLFVIPTALIALLIYRVKFRKSLAASPSS